MRQVMVAISVATLLAAPVSARYVGPGTAKSWGKPGVSFDTYRDDAVACGRQAAALDISDSEPAKAMALASRMIETAPDVAAMAEVTNIASPERNMLKTGDLLQAEIERCLIGRGYHKFKLTPAQRRKLGKLPLGSDERHNYLHSLGSDPAVLERQKTD